MIQQKQSRQLAARTFAALALSGLVLTTVGCDEDDQANATITEASHLIAAVNAGGGQSANAPHREDTYDRVISMLRPVVSGSSDATKASAQVIVAQAQAGKGRIQSGQASALENQCSLMISRAHNEADLFASHSALASALVAYDMQPEFEEISTQNDAVAEEIETVRARIRGIDERVAQLQERADAAREEAASRQRHETELRAEAVHVGAEERKQMITEAVGYQREADAFEAEYVMVEAGIEQLRQTRVSVQADLDRLATQRTLLEEADRNAQLRMQVASDESEAAEEAAFEAARRLRTIVREIETLRSGALVEAYTAAEETLRSAASSMSAGARADRSREGKDSNSVTSGLIYQSLGELHKTRATGAAGYAALLDRLTNLEPSPPDRNDYLGMLDRTESALDEALAAADEAFVEAADALEGVGGSDAMRERIDRVVTSLRGEASEIPGDAAGETDDFEG